MDVAYALIGFALGLTVAAVIVLIKKVIIWEQAKIIQENIEVTL